MKMVKIMCRQKGNKIGMNDGFKKDSNTIVMAVVSLACGN